MDTVVVILYFAIILAILLSPVFITYVLWVKVKFGKYLAVIFICFISFQIYLTLNPDDSFYMKEFKKITKLEFPKSGKIIKKHASLPDIHGDYESCALIDLSENDYKILKAALDNKDEHRKEYPNSTCDTEWFSKKGTILKYSTYTKKGGFVSIWGLIKNKNQAFISYVSW